MFHVKRYLPIQNSLNIFPSKSSEENSPVIEDKAFWANISSSANNYEESLWTKPIIMLALTSLRASICRDRAIYIVSLLL